jgi:hypothetical protein
MLLKDINPEEKITIQWYINIVVKIIEQIKKKEGIKLI